MVTGKLCVVCAALSERVWRVEVAELRRVTSFRRRFRAATGEWNANGYTFECHASHLARARSAPIVSQSGLIFSRSAAKP